MNLQTLTQKVAEIGLPVSMSAYLTFVGTHVDPLIKLGTLILIVINVWLGVRKLRSKSQPKND